MAHPSDRDLGIVLNNLDDLGTEIPSCVLRNSTSAEPINNRNPRTSTVPTSSTSTEPADSYPNNTCESETRYFMSNKSRGVALIINNKFFHSSLQLPDRTGSDLDTTALEKTFLSLGFNDDNIHRYDNVTRQDMERLMSHFASKVDYRDMDCFMCAILSHGDECAVYGQDRKISLELLFHPFRTEMHPTLVGKPKIFLNQACRGEKLDDGLEKLEHDSLRVQVLPSEADFLFAYSTVPGYYSWRNTTKGTWFVQAISHNVVKHRKSLNMDFVRLLTRVNYDVAYQFRSDVPDKPKMHLKKQMPSIVSMLTKDLFFPANE